MRRFRVLFTGDTIDEAGKLRSEDLGIAEMEASGFIETGFLLDQAPKPDDRHYWERLYSLEITADHVEKADAIVIVRPWLKAGAFARGAERLLAVGRAGVGYDKIDLDACTQHDVVVFNAPDSLTHSTASAALTLMLALAKKLPQQQNLVSTGRWDRQPELYGDDLVGKTLGIIGLGKTGQELARLVAPFHMRVIAYSPRADRFAAQAAGVELVATLDDLLGTSDFVSLHCRLEKHTHHLLNRDKLCLLKSTAYLINVARGEMIDEAALYEALREHRLAGAGLDVFATEPLPTSSALLRLDNVILTPHWLPSTRRAAAATRAAMVEGMLRIATGRRPNNVLNPEVLTRPAFIEKLARFEVNRHNG